MKYTVASGECCSPKSPTVVIFPPFNKTHSMSEEPLNMAQQCTDAKEVYSGPLPAVHCTKSNGNGSSSYQMITDATSPGVHFQSPPNFNIHPSGIDPARQRYSHADLINDNSSNEFYPTQAQGPNAMDVRLNNRSDPHHHIRRKSIDEEADTTDKPFINKFSLIIIVFMILVSAAISVMSLVFVMKVQQQMEDLQTKYDSLHTSQAQTAREPNICLPCTELEQGPLPEDTPELKDLLKMNENGLEMCCAKTGTQVALLLNLFSKRKQLEKCALEELKNENQPATSCNSTGPPGSAPLPPTQPLYGNVSAHLQAGSQPDNLDREQPIQNWQVGLDAPGTHLTNIEMTADKKYLVIPSTGRYFLYSQVGFLIYYNEDTPIDPEQGSQSLFHFVYRYNHLYAGKQELLRSDITQCWEKNKDYGRYTSYVGASVLLNKGDKIYVEVSKLELLSRGESSLTYFGLFKMG
ncbi:uncharacterized protein LOC128214200 isoform X1 [Mya arenaria]|uniref:uncharacterized protein LOC128214200 isoform X1 n=2 Tax=Mya arenaria TaxID=6604 RepID=UPI0022E4BA94|nr:uncharacterized protein LOC128214200 isoform X1 [Mya arenaria]